MNLSGLSNGAIRLIFLVFIAGGLHACKKNNTENPNPAENVKPYIKLVRSIEYDNGITATMHYNEDSTLKKISYRYGNVLNATIFNWENQRLKEFYEDRSLYKNTFHYIGSGISYYVNTYKDIQLPSSYKMEYSYDDKARVTVLKHYTTNEAGTTLKATSTYHYNSASVLERVETKDNSAVYTHLIESYSDMAYFNPLLFIETGLWENYPVFNIPVLSSMKGFPAKIIRKVKIGNEATYIDKIEENTVLIADKNISRIINNVTSPGMSGYNKRVVAVFKY
ncbi:MAG: hypothetical protein QM768_11965 [Agriterribacter sp.]